MYGKHKSQTAGLSLEPTRNSLSEMIHSLRATVRLIGGQNRPTLRLQGGGRWSTLSSEVAQNASETTVDTREETLEYDIIIRATENQLHAI